MTQEQPARPHAVGAREVRTRVTRTIVADPTSTALLLAGPGAFALWPGARHLGPASRGALVKTDLGFGRTVAVTVRALPPRRTATAYVSRFAWSGAGLPATTGTLTLSYASTVPAPGSAAAAVRTAGAELPAAGAALHGAGPRGAGPRGAGPTTAALRLSAPFGPRAAPSEQPAAAWDPWLLPVTVAVLVLSSVDLPEARADELGLRRMAAGFLTNLGAAAEERSQAA